MVEEQLRWGWLRPVAHPFRAGVQNPLIQILLDHGADIDHETSAGNRQNAVNGAFGERTW